MRVYCQQRGKRQERTVLKNPERFRVAPADSHFIFQDQRVRIKLRQTFREPQWHPLAGSGCDEMRLLVINRPERMESGPAQPDQNIILVRRGLKKSSKSCLAWGEINARL